MSFHMTLPHPNLYNFVVSVSTVEQVLEMFNAINAGSKKGMSINATLRNLKKDRKSLERFKHIYYLQVVDSDSFNKVSFQKNPLML